MEKIFHQLSNDNEHKNIFLEMKFICLKNNIIRDFKDIFSRKFHEISLKNIFNYSYIE